MNKPKNSKLYMHQPTGNIMYATKKQAKALNDEWHEVQFVANEKGERVMRFTFKDPRGVTATVDVQAANNEEVQKHVEPIAS